MIGPNKQRQVTSMLADEERYAALRQSQRPGAAYEHDWHAARILERLSKLSPHFLPQALGRLSEQPDGTKHFHGIEERATLDRFIAIYHEAGQHLHSTNPANIDGLYEQADRRLGSRERLAEQLRYLKSILWDHVKVGLAWTDDEPASAWIVNFGPASEFGVTMLVAAGVEENVHAPNQLSP